MSLHINSAIAYNKSIKYSQKAIGIIQFFCRCSTTGVFDEQTVKAVYKTQQSPLYGFNAKLADGMVGPGTLGVMIMELDYAMRKQEADVLRAYAYKINGVMQNANKLPPLAPKPQDVPEPEEEVSLADKDKPRQARLSELVKLKASAFVLRPGGGESYAVGNLFLATTDIRKLLGGSADMLYYMVVKTESAVLDPFFIGKVYRQTTRGFKSDVDWAWAAEVARRSKGGQAMMKKEVELLMGAVCAGVGAFGGFAAVTGAAMQFLLMNSKELFIASRGIQELLKVRGVLSANTPEFWKLCVTVLKLSVVKTPEAMWSDQYGSTRLVGELVMIVGQAVLLKKFKSLGLVTELMTKVLLGAFGKLTDAATIALAGKDLVKLMKDYDPMINEARAQTIVTELKDNWSTVGPALSAFKAAADQMAGA